MASERGTRPVEGALAPGRQRRRPRLTPRFWAVDRRDSMPVRSSAIANRSTSDQLAEPPQSHFRRGHDRGTRKPRPGRVAAARDLSLRLAALRPACHPSPPPRGQSLLPRPPVSERQQELPELSRLGIAKGQPSRTRGAPVRRSKSGCVRVEHLLLPPAWP